MKILSIRLKNLASLAGEQFIDFEIEPLHSAGLIAIIGRTGAGKSTILDAMCLALYNKIPRLKEGDGKLKDVDGSDILSNSPVNILRRGTASGFAELCFVAQDQKIYSVRWEIKRAREQHQGKLQSIQRSLKCLTDGVVIADKVKAVEQHILQITQLSFEQFTRAVLLAQSEVTAFLKARDNERGELLEYLTNSAIFAKIGQLAYERTKQITNQRKELENVLGHIQVLSEDQLSTLTKNYQEIQAHHLQLEQQSNAFKVKQQWFTQQHQIHQDLLIQQKIYDEKCAEFNVLEPDRQLLAQLEIFSDIRPKVYQQQELLEHQKSFDQQFNAQQQQFTTLNHDFQQEKQQFELVEQTFSDLQMFEDKYQTELNGVRKSIQEREYIAEEYKLCKKKINDISIQQQPLIKQNQQLNIHLTQLQSQQKQFEQRLKADQNFAKLDVSLTAHIQQVQQFIQYYQDIEKKIGSVAAAKQQLSTHQSELQQIEQKHGSSVQLEQQIEKYSHERENKQLALQKLSQISDHFLRYVDVLNEQNALITQAQQFQNQLEQLTHSLKDSEQHYASAKTEREKIQKVLQQQRFLHSENIVNLRQALQDNEPCSVCGSTEHPYRVDHDQLSNALFKLQQQQEASALLDEKKCFDIWQKNQQQFTQVKTTHEQIQTSENTVQQRLDQLKTQIENSLMAIDIAVDATLPFTDYFEKIKQHIVQYQDDITQLNTLIAGHQKCLKQVRQLQQSIQQFSQQLDRIEYLEQNIKHIFDCQTHDGSTSQLTHAQNILSILIQRARVLTSLEQVSKDLGNTQQQLDLIQNNLQHLDNLHQEHQTLFKQIEQKGQQNTDFANQLIAKMDSQNQLKAPEWLAKHEQKFKQAQQQYQHGKHTFEQVKTKFEQFQNQMDQLKAKREHNAERLNACDADIAQWREKNLSFADTDLNQLLQLSVQEQTLRQTILNAERSLQEATSLLKVLQQRLQQHFVSQPNIDEQQLSQRVLQLDEEIQQIVEQRDQFKMQLEIHQQNLAQYQTIFEKIAAIQLQEQRWHKISSLIGDKEGKNFRNLAQQYHLDILLEYANQQLAMLSQRYVLKRLEDSLGLAIIDQDMDGEVRSVASLSGGETFLVSLALALAIANMASGLMKLDSLFIDEGFGTLDPDSLHIAMDALDRLQSQGRKVILISHVQEMHERIPVQIQVRAMGAGTSEITISG